MDDVWSIDEQCFNARALDLFQFQAKNNEVYAEYMALIDKSADKVQHYSQIPFLPIGLFKERQILCDGFKSSHIYESSSTTGKGTSKHHMHSLALYFENAKRIFEPLFGALQDVEVLGLLPNYLERQSSSLIGMVNHFIEESKTPSPQYFLYDHEALARRIQKATKPVILFGVSFALLDFVAQHQITQDRLVVIETGGMKGRKKEILKSELHQQLRRGFPNALIASEYGMTELSSQAYAKNSEIYTPPPWMKVMTRLDNDPFSLARQGQRGGLNVIDLANMHSCAFIATDDLGMVNEDGSFQVIGRLDLSDLRGCSLLVS